MPRARVWMAAVVLLTAAPAAYAQETQQADGPEAVNTPAPRVAVPRAAAPERARTPDRAATQQPRRAEPAPPRGGAGGASADRGGDDRPRARPRGGPPGGDTPPTGTAVPRSGGGDW